jgi:hypothetical protein
MRSLVLRLIFPPLPPPPPPSFPSPHLRELLEVLLRVRADLHDGARGDHGGNLLPVPSELAEARDEHVMLCGMVEEGDTCEGVVRGDRDGRAP